MVRRATLTTVPSSSVSPEPRTAAATIARPVVLPYATWPLVELMGGQRHGPPDSSPEDGSPGLP